MKPITCALAIVVAALGSATARADSRVNIGVEVNMGPTYGAPRYAPPAPSYYPAPARSYSPVRGHWEDVTVKTWVPERWVMGRDRWGRHVRVLEKGYFTYRTERVWVDSHRGGAYGYADRRHG